MLYFFYVMVLVRDLGKWPVDYDNALPTTMPKP